MCDKPKDLRELKRFLKETKQDASSNLQHSGPKLDEFLESTKEIVLRETAPVKNRIELAIKALNLGGEPTEICRLLDWREFEKLSLKAFQLNQYEAIKGITFKAKKRRFQIDVLAYKDKTLLCVDCKHWMFSHWFSRLKEATASHLRRTEALAGNIGTLTNKLSFKLSKNFFTIPVMLTLGDPRSRTIDGVPIVSVLQLRDFLYGLPYPSEAGLKYFVSELS